MAESLSECTHKEFDKEERDKETNENPLETRYLNIVNCRASLQALGPPGPAQPNIICMAPELWWCPAQHFRVEVM